MVQDPSEIIFRALEILQSFSSAARSTVFYLVHALDGYGDASLRTTVRGRGRFVSVSIPEELMNEIDKRGGYESRPEFIKEAVRKRLEEIKAFSK